MGNTRLLHHGPSPATIKLAPRPNDNPYVAANKDQWSLTSDTLKQLDLRVRRGRQDKDYDRWRTNCTWAIGRHLWEGAASPVESHAETLSSDLWHLPGPCRQIHAKAVPGRKLRRAVSGVLVGEQCRDRRGMCDIKDERKTTLFNFGEEPPARRRPA